MRSLEKLMTLKIQAKGRKFLNWQIIFKVLSCCMGDLITLCDQLDIMLQLVWIIMPGGILRDSKILISTYWKQEQYIMSYTSLKIKKIFLPYNQDEKDSRLENEKKIHSSNDQIFL